MTDENHQLIKTRRELRYTRKGCRTESTMCEKERLCSCQHPWRKDGEMDYPADRMENNAREEKTRFANMRRHTRTNTTGGSR